MEAVVRERPKYVQWIARPHEPVEPGVGMDDGDVTILVRREIGIGRHGERGEAVGPFAPARAPDRCDAEEGIITDQARGVDRLATLHQTELARQQQARAVDRRGFGLEERRSEEHTSELQSLMRISYAVFCLKKQTHK